MTRRHVDSWFVPDYGWDDQGTARIYQHRDSPFAVVRQFSGERPWHLFEGELFLSAYASPAAAMKAVDTREGLGSKHLDLYEAVVRREVLLHVLFRLFHTWCLLGRSSQGARTPRVVDLFANLRSVSFDGARVRIATFELCQRMLDDSGFDLHLALLVERGAARRTERVIVLWSNALACRSAS